MPPAAAEADADVDALGLGKRAFFGLSMHEDTHHDTVDSAVAASAIAPSSRAIAARADLLHVFARDAAMATSSAGRTYGSSGGG